MTTHSELKAFITGFGWSEFIITGNIFFSTVHLAGFAFEQEEYSAVPSGQVKYTHAKNSRRQTEINEKLSRLLYKHDKKNVFDLKIMR